MCGLSSPTKQQQVLNLIEYKNYDIFGLSETKLKSAVSKHLYKHQDCYKSWWNCNDDSPASSGVGLIIKKDIATFVQSVHGYKGRVIYANLYLKGRYKLRIMQVYIQAHTLDPAARHDVDKYIINNIIQAERDGFKVIIMGDFNVDSDQLHASLLNNKKPHWKYNLIQKLEDLQFVDCYSLFHEDTQPTWISPNS